MHRDVSTNHLRADSAPAKRLVFVLLGVGSLAGVLVGACREPADRVDRGLPRELWKDELSWHRVEGGWARGIVLDEPRAMPVTPPGSALEAVVFPKGQGELVLESAGASQRVPLAMTRRVRIPLADEPGASLAFEGASAVVHGARIVAGTAGRKSAPRRVLLTVVDTLRADHVDGEHMPEIRAYFRDGASFTRAHSSASWTLPSMASLFTGRLPADLRLPDGTLVALSPGAPTLARSMSEGGFHAVGVSANYTINHENGFSEGFDLFLVPSVTDHGAWPDIEWVLERARRALEWFGDRDLFLYLHAMDPHDPYRNHETGEVWPAPSSGTSVDASRLAELRRAYASEVRRTGRLLGDFLAQAEPVDLAVFTADHGEEFAEHGGFKHGPTVYPEVSRVPLLVRGEGVVSGEWSHPVSLVELGGLIAEGDQSLFRPGKAVTVESFAHAPPRWAWVHPQGQTILFARRLGGAGPLEDPIGRWLAEHHPRLVHLGNEGTRRQVTADEGRAAAERLARQFHGLRRGLWIWFPPTSERHLLTVTGVTGSGWCWGDGRGARLGLLEAGEGRLEIEGPVPFWLVFLEASQGEAKLSRGGVTVLEAPPAELSAERPMAWPDPGRPASETRGVEETMQRLRNLGYL